MSGILQSASDGNGRARGLKIAVAVWLLLVGLLAIVNSIGLLRVVAQAHSSAQDAPIQVLVLRMEELERQLETLKHLPPPLTQADLDTVRQALDERLAHVEQAQTAEDRTGEVQALQARIGAIEARLKKTAPAVAVAPRRTAEPVAPRMPEPPFHVVGPELRGAERFLSVAASGAASVRDLRLLREGEALGAWHLQSIEARTAVFRVDGQTLRIPLP